MDDVPIGLTDRLRKRVESVDGVVSGTVMVRTRFVGNRPFVEVKLGTVRGASLESAHQLSEVLPPGLQHGFVDVQSFGQLILGLDDQVHVRVLLIGMHDHRVSMQRKVGPCEGSRGREYFVPRCGVGHR